MTINKQTESVQGVEHNLSSDKVQQILTGAMQEFLDRGYSGASMDRVAARAKVSKATVYNHFQDKQTLFKTLVSKLISRRFDSIFGSEPLQGEPQIVLRELAKKSMEQMSEDEEYKDFMRVLIGESKRFPELAQICVEFMAKPVTQTLTAYFQSRPEFNFTDPEAIARIIIGGLVHFHIVQEIMHGEEILPMESARIVDGLMYLLMAATKCCP